MPADSSSGDPICIDSDDEAPSGHKSTDAIAAQAALAASEQTCPTDRLACGMQVPNRETALKAGARSWRCVGRVSVVRRGSRQVVGDDREAELELEFTRLVGPPNSRLLAPVQGTSFRLPATSVYAAEVCNGYGAVVLRVDPPADATPLLRGMIHKSRGRGIQDGAEEEPHFLSELALVPDQKEISVVLATLRWWLPHVTFQGPQPPGAASTGTLRLDNIEFTARDAQHLRDERCLNDTALDFFLRLVVEVVAPESLRDDIYIANCFFFQKLTSNNAASGEEGWENVARWTRSLPGGLLEKRFVLVPINEQNLHWWAAIVCHPGRALDEPEAGAEPEAKGEVPRIVCLDSAIDPPPKGRATAFLRGYLWREWCERNPERAPLKGGLEEGGQPGKVEKDTRVLKTYHADVPKQANGYDCGIFIIEYLLHLLQSRSALKGLGLAPHRHWFNQDAVSHRRKRLRWVVSRLQAEAKRRKQTDVMKLLQDDTVRAAVTGALIEVPRTKRRWSSEPGASQAEPPATRGRFSSHLQAASLLRGGFLQAAAVPAAVLTPGLQLPVARRPPAEVGQHGQAGQFARGSLVRPAEQSRAGPSTRTTASEEAQAPASEPSGDGDGADSSGDEDVEIPPAPGQPRAEGVRRLIAKPCEPAVPGDKAADEPSKIHPTHSLFYSGKLVWCAVCGLYGGRQIRSLAGPCSAAPTRRGLLNLAALRRREHPDPCRRVGLLPPAVPA